MILSAVLVLLTMTTNCSGSKNDIVDILDDEQLPKPGESLEYYQGGGMVPPGSPNFVLKLSLKVTEGGSILATAITPECTNSKTIYLNDFIAVAIALQKAEVFKSTQQIMDAGDTFISFKTADSSKKLFLREGGSTYNQMVVKKEDADKIIAKIEALAENVLEGVDCEDEPSEPLTKLIGVKVRENVNLSDKIAAGLSADGKVIAHRRTKLEVSFVNNQTIINGFDGTVSASKECFRHFKNKVYSGDLLKEAAKKISIQKVQATCAIALVHLGEFFPKSVTLEYTGKPNETGYFGCHVESLVTNSEEFAALLEAAVAAEPQVCKIIEQPPTPVTTKSAVLRENVSDAGVNDGTPTFLNEFQGSKTWTNIKVAVSSNSSASVSGTQIYATYDKLCTTSINTTGGAALVAALQKVKVNKSPAICAIALVGPMPKYRRNLLLTYSNGKSDKAYFGCWESPRLDNAEDFASQITAILAKQNTKCIERPVPPAKTLTSIQLRENHTTAGVKAPNRPNYTNVLARFSGNKTSLSGYYQTVTAAQTCTINLNGAVIDDAGLVSAAKAVKYQKYNDYCLGGDWHIYPKHMIFGTSDGASTLGYLGCGGPIRVTNSQNFEAILKKHILSRKASCVSHPRPASIVSVNLKENVSADGKHTNPNKNLYVNLTTKFSGDKVTVSGTFKTIRKDGGFCINSFNGKVFNNAKLIAAAQKIAIEKTNIVCMMRPLDQYPKSITVGYSNGASNTGYFDCTHQNQAKNVEAYQELLYSLAKSADGYVCAVP